MVCICGHPKSEHVEGEWCTHMKYLVGTLCSCEKYEEAGF